MTQAAKPDDARATTSKLRDLRLADEAARKTAGTWGDLSVGEITHRPSRSVYVQVWKGARRPAVVGASNCRVAGVPSAEWPNVSAWLDNVRDGELHRSIVAWSVSKTEAQRLKAKRIAENRAAGITIVNQAESQDG
jgi:hypothetical protein